MISKYHLQVDDNNWNNTTISCIVEGFLAVVVEKFAKLTYLTIFLDKSIFYPNNIFLVISSSLQKLDEPVRGVFLSRGKGLADMGFEVKWKACKLRNE